MGVGLRVNLDQLVEHHAAVLGATGTGKTELTLDLVREAVKRDFWVFCVDFTGEYRLRLSDLSPEFPSVTPEEASDLEEKLFAVETGKFGAKDERRALKPHLDALGSSIDESVDELLGNTRGGLAILELSEIAHSWATLQLTELYLSAIMSWARKHRRARKIMIVLEEAHTIIPEVHNTGLASDVRLVVSKIGQIALQGRKYGVGLLVVSQRTALVSKTILSQCNTFFTHALIDQTSLSFLESVYSKAQVRRVPNLRPFEFMVHGKAIGAQRPVVLQREFSQARKEASESLRRPLTPRAEGLRS